MGNSQKCESDPDEDPESYVQQRDRQQVAANALRRFADRLRRHRQMRAAGEAQHLVAQLFAVLHQEEDEDDDEESGRDKLHRRRECLVAIGDVAPLRNHANF